MKNAYKRWIKARSAKRRARRMWLELEMRYQLECRSTYPIIAIGGLIGSCYSVEFHGWGRATREMPEIAKRHVRRAMRFANWLHAHHLWPV